MTNVRGLFVEYRSQEEATVRVRQIIVFDSCVYSRSINTENPRRHWKAFEISKPSETPIGERFPILRTWLADVDRQFTAAKYEMTTAPFLVEATQDEYNSQILAGETPRNVLLRVERVRKDAGRPDPLERV